MGTEADIASYARGRREEKRREKGAVEEIGR